MVTIPGNKNATLCSVTHQLPNQSYEIYVRNSAFIISLV